MRCQQWLVLFRFMASPRYSQPFSDLWPLSDSHVNSSALTCCQSSVCFPLQFQVKHSQDGNDRIGYMWGTIGHLLDRLHSQSFDLQEPLFIEIMASPRFSQPFFDLGPHSDSLVNSSLFTSYQSSACFPLQLQIIHMKLMTTGYPWGTVDRLLNRLHNWSVDLQESIFI
jgi:hypothetical protein